METISVSIRFPKKIYDSLKDYLKTEKPHMSFNALVVEATRESLEQHSNILRGKTQISPDLIRAKNGE